MHPGSKDTYDFINNWIRPDFFFSVKDLWDRMGMLGVFGDYVLSCTKGEYPRDRRGRKLYLPLETGHEI